MSVLAALPTTSWPRVANAWRLRGSRRRWGIAMPPGHSRRSSTTPPSSARMRLPSLVFSRPIPCSSMSRSRVMSFRQWRPVIGSILHAGPPIAWSAMCGPMRGAVLGAILLERWADTLDAADSPRRRGNRRARALPPPWRRRADGRRHQPVDAGLGRRKHDGWQPCLLQLQRRAGQGAALRCQRPQRHRSPSLDRERRRANAARGRQAARQDRAQAADGAGAEHGRRSAQSQRRGNLAPVQAARSGSAQRGSPSGACRDGA